MEATLDRPGGKSFAPPEANKDNPARERQSRHTHRYSRHHRSHHHTHRHSRHSSRKSRRQGVDTRITREADELKSPTEFAPPTESEPKTSKKSKRKALQSTEPEKQAPTAFAPPAAEEEHEFAPPPSQADFVALVRTTDKNSKRKAIASENNDKPSQIDMTASFAPPPIAETEVPVAPKGKKAKRKALYSDAPADPSTETSRITAAVEAPVF